MQFSFFIFFPSFSPLLKYYEERHTLRNILRASYKISKSSYRIFEGLNYIYYVYLYIDNMRKLEELMLNNDSCIYGGCDGLYSK